MEISCNEAADLSDAALLPLNHQVQYSMSVSKQQSQTDCTLPAVVGSLCCSFAVFRPFCLCRREIREAGMTLIFDGRKTNPQPQLYQALMTLQVSNVILPVD